MKQRQYTELQKEIMKVLGRLAPYIRNSTYGLEEIEQIRKDYNIKEPYLTLRQYIRQESHGAYHTFHFSLNNKQISINTIGDMLTDDWCSLYPLTEKFYVIGDRTNSQGGNCENYHCDHNLTLEPKED